LNKSVKFKTINFVYYTNVYYYIPQNKNVTTPILFVLHGTERNANQYQNAMIAKAESMGFIVIAP
jgi:poly(3-hydroxybutyrate) depolymerase